jgi:hypothetical protein
MAIFAKPENELIISSQLRCSSVQVRPVLYMNIEGRQVG